MIESHVGSTPDWARDQIDRGTFKESGSRVIIKAKGQVKTKSKVNPIGQGPTQV